MAPCDFFLFSQLKLCLRDHRFESINSIKEYSLGTLKRIHKNDFKARFGDWKKRWQKGIAAGGDNFEGAAINFY